MHARMHQSGGVATLSRMHAYTGTTVLLISRLNVRRFKAIPPPTHLPPSLHTLPASQSGKADTLKETISLSGPYAARSLRLFGSVHLPHFSHFSLPFLISFDPGSLLILLPWCSLYRCLQSVYLVSLVLLFLLYCHSLLSFPIA